MDTREKKGLGRERIQLGRKRRIKEKKKKNGWKKKIYRGEGKRQATGEEENRKVMEPWEKEN